MRKWVAGLTLLAALTVRHVLLAYWPGLLTMSLFWGLLLLTLLIRGGSILFLFPGLLSNAIAVLANGGFMPVFGYGSIEYDGFHIEGTPETAFPRLCDRFGGASIGDFLIFAAFIAFIVHWIVLKCLPNNNPTRA